MKKVIFLIAFSALSFIQVVDAQATCEGVNVSAYPKRVQSGSYDYYGVQVALTQPFIQDITVVGTITEEGGQNVVNMFTLTVTAENLMARTSETFYSVPHGRTVVVSVESIDPCPDFAHDTTNLYLKSNFIEFAQNFLIAFLNYSAIHDVPSIQQNSQAFIDAISNSDQEETTVATIYSNYSANFDSAMIYKNQMDNSFLNLINDFPALKNVEDSNQLWQIVVTALDLGMSSADAEWISIQNNFLQSAEMLAGNPTIANKFTSSHPAFFIAFLKLFSGGYGLTLGEVWNCMLEAAGLGAASAFGIGKLVDLAAKEGIQQVVVTVSKWLAKRAGWVGAIVIAIDLAKCIYYEARD